MPDNSFGVSPLALNNISTAATWFEFESFDSMWLKIWDVSVEVKSWLRISFSMYGLRVVICWVEELAEEEEDCKAEEEVGEEAWDLFRRNVEWGVGEDNNVKDWTEPIKKFVVNRRRRHAFWKIMIYCAA